MVPINDQVLLVSFVYKVRPNEPDFDMFSVNGHNRVTKKVVKSFNPSL